MMAVARPRPTAARFAVALFPFGLLLSAGCNRDNAPDTGIIVRVTSDLRVPDEISQVNLTARDPQGDSLYDRTFLLGEGQDRVELPIRAGLYPLHDTSTPIHIEVVGQVGGQFVVSRSATLSFVRGKKVLLDLPLLGVCKGQKCPDGNTCNQQGNCDTDAVSNLPPYVPNQPVPDASSVIRDAATSADTAGDRATDIATEAAGGRDAFSATGDAGGTDGPSGMGGAIGTDGGTGAVDVPVPPEDARQTDAPPDLPLGGSGGTGGTKATGGMTGSGGMTNSGGNTGGATVSGGTTSSGGTATTGGITVSGGTTSSGGTTTTGGITVSGGTTSSGGTAITGGTTVSGGTTGTGGTTTTGGTTVSGGTTSSGGTTTTGGTTSSGGATSSGGTTTTGGMTGSGGSGGTTARCAGLAATCGPSGNGDCCASLLVPGGTFYRSYDAVANTDMSFPATVSDFYLDKYEITVGRFRQFVNAGMGSQASPPAAGAGAHPLISGSGWSSTWNTRLPTDTAGLTAAVKCDSIYQTWTDTVAGNESQPQNCLSWYTAFAFCAWDGGRLPTEAEWNYAAAGGSEQRYYPWSSPATSTTIDASYAVYSYSGTLNVGSKSPKGDGKWGHADLGGNVSEWTLDWYASPYLTPCDNCAELSATSNVVIRGGDFNSTPLYLRSSTRPVYYPTYHYANTGARCARTSP